MKIVDKYIENSFSLVSFFLSDQIASGQKAKTGIEDGCDMQQVNVNKMIDRTVSMR
jgi:hypothetical protein